jgi:ubiquinone/menaquinone biosynthesis C-methylase UbiE
MSAIIDAYSRLAAEYDDQRNLSSCWGTSAAEVLASIRLEDDDRVVADIGCGTGRALAHLASMSEPDRAFIGVEPAANMRARAEQLTKAYPNVRILAGAFESLPMAPASVDYLYSIHAFHWTTDLSASVQELARVLKPSGELNLFFTGRHNGREFLRKTTPIYLRYMGPTLLLQSAAMRKQLTTETARLLFEPVFGHNRVAVTESYRTYYDSLEGHWSWWVRAEGHFSDIPPDRKRQCDDDIRQTLATLATDQGIPYTIHLIHVRVRPQGSP